MSGIQITVVTSNKPEQLVLQSYIQLHPEMYLNGQLGNSAPSGKLRSPRVELRRKLITTEHESPIEIYGPHRVFEDEDLPLELATLVPAPCWQIEVASISSEQGWKDALDLAEHIARSCKGAVWTGETGVMWPPSAKPPPRIKEEGRRIDILTLEWFVHSSKPSVQSAQPFLDVIRDNLPGARPVRFGTIEPLQGQLSLEDDQPLLEAWKDCDESEHLLELLFFKSKSPCFGGHVRFRAKFRPIEGEPSSQLRLRPLRPTEEVIRINMEFDGGALLHDNELNETVVRLFSAMARRLDCFYAHGYVERNYFWYRGSRQTMPILTELYPLPLGHEWVGIPPAPVWLNWFGRPYMPLVMDSVRRSEPVGDG